AAELAADPARTGFPGVVGEPSVSSAFVEGWLARTGRASRLAMKQGIYRCARVLAGARAPGRLRPAGPGGGAPGRRWSGACPRGVLAPEAPAREHAARPAAAGLRAGELRRWGRDGAGPLAVAGWSAPTANGIRSNAVYTPPENRRQGLAEAA